LSMEAIDSLARHLDLSVAVRGKPMKG
jgi:hypothetical protein